MLKRIYFRYFSTDAATGDRNLNLCYNGMYLHLCNFGKKD